MYFINCIYYKNYIILLVLKFIYFLVFIDEIYHKTIKTDFKNINKY